LLGRSELTPHAERGLVAYLRREAAAVFDDAELMARARSGLVEHDYLLLRERHIRRLTIIAAAMPAERDLWVPRLLAPIEEGGISRREWLDAVFAKQMEKVEFHQPQQREVQKTGHLDRAVRILDPRQRGRFPRHHPPHKIFETSERQLRQDQPVDAQLLELAAAFATLDALVASPNALPASTLQPFGPSWQVLIDQPDRAAALGCYRAATLMGLKRALRNRSVSVDHSLSYRAPEEKLIPQKLWQRDRGRFIRDLNLPVSSEKYLQRLEAGLSAGLAALAEAVEAGAVAIEGGELRLPRRKPVLKDPRLEPARQTLAHALGDVQFPEVLIEIDGLTRFSWTLLGRPARSEQEWVTLYAALMGLGSDLSVAELVRMVPALAADSLGQMMVKIEAERRLRSANNAVLSFMREHPVAALWGRGLYASADMMSLEATRYLWSARLDPRRRTYPVGTTLMSSTNGASSTINRSSSTAGKPTPRSRAPCASAKSRGSSVSPSTRTASRISRWRSPKRSGSTCVRTWQNSRSESSICRKGWKSRRFCGRSWPKPSPAAPSREAGRDFCGSALR
jgi:Tn3 transposase DDE domain